MASGDSKLVQAWSLVAFGALGFVVSSVHLSRVVREGAGEQKHGFGPPGEMPEVHVLLSDGAPRRHA